MLALFLLSVTVLGQHCWYNGFDVQMGVSIKQNWKWSTIPKCSSRYSCDQAFASQQYTTDGGGNVMGYFGMQQTSSGMKAICSLWDYSDSIKSASGLYNWCSRFGGEGEGAHCMLDYNFQANVEYEMEMYVASADSKGSTLQCVIVNSATGQRTNVGALYSQAVYGKYPQNLGPSASFLEYFAGGNFYSAITMRGPWINYNYGPSEGVSDCDGSPPSSVTGSDPYGNHGKPYTYYQKGSQVQKQCGNMWGYEESDSSFNKTTIHSFKAVYDFEGPSVFDISKASVNATSTNFTDDMGAPVVERKI